MNNSWFATTAQGGHFGGSIESNFFSKNLHENSQRREVSDVTCTPAIGVNYLYAFLSELFVAVALDFRMEKHNKRIA